MWIVRLALRRPYTFVVAAILVAILGVFTAVKVMPTDIFPEINIPVISICFNYSGMSPDDMEKRIVTPYERILTTTVNNIEHIESQSLYGVGVIKVYFQPGAEISVANAQITAIAQTALRQLPTGTQPPLILQYSASEVPVVELSLSSDTIPEQILFDTAFNAIRPNLISIPGVQIPYPYGGKQRAIMVDIEPDRLYAWGISPADVSAAIGNQNLILPAGTVKIGTQEYQVRLNGSPTQADELNNLPVKTVTNADGSKTVVYVKDVAHVRDGFQVQTNIVHYNGKRALIMPILKSGDASTLTVVNAVRAKLPAVTASLPPNAKGLKIEPLFDQSVFVRASVEGVVKEAAIAAGLTGLMILLFLGSWRSTLIVIVSIPLSILVSIIILGALGQTLNTMTLGGMALAVGILVDDATVEIENIHRNLHMRKRLVQAILDGAQQIAVPAFVSTLCICIVFVPVAFIAGTAKFLFTPLAMAVVFAMMTSYLLSRTLVPTMVHYLLAAEVEMYGGKLDPHDPHAKHAIEQEQAREHGQYILPQQPAWKRHPALKIGLMAGAAVLVVLVGLLGYTPVGGNLPVQSAIQSAGTAVIENPRVDAMVALAVLGVIAAFILIAKYNLVWRFHFVFNRQFERVQRIYGGFLAWALQHRPSVLIGFSCVVAASLVLFNFVGQDFFPSVDAGQIRLHVRTPAGTRIEQTERYYAQVQDIIRQVIPHDQIQVVLDNMGIPNSSINLSLSDGSVNAPSEGEILISLKEEHDPSVNFIREIRNRVSRDMPNIAVWSAPSDIATQVLNFGLPASIDVQVQGPAFNSEKNLEIARAINKELASVPGVTDRRMQQVTDAPDLRDNVDRTLAGQVGVTQKDVANDLLISLSSTNQIAPNFWLSPTNGVSYAINVQTPQYRMGTINDLTNTPIVPTIMTGDTDSNNGTQLLGNLATLGRGTTPSNITHYDVKPTYDILLSTQYLDLGRVSDAVQKVVDKYSAKKPKGTDIILRGQVESMHESFTGLGIGLVFAIVLVYLLMVINFQSWLDPLIILMALPGAAAGILWMLWATHTTLSVPSLMGAMMSVGVATSNSILMITFANDQRKELGRNAHDAALAAGITRLRPVMMTAAAMIIGMLPMSLGLGEGGEQNAPLGRAVIGGLLMATFATLIFVPVVYSLLRNKPLVTEVEEELK